MYGMSSFCFVLFKVKENNKKRFIKYLSIQFIYLSLAIVFFYIYIYISLIYSTAYQRYKEFEHRLKVKRVIMGTKILAKIKGM